MGYARVSTKDQTIDLQVDALTQAGCTKVYTEIISGARAERPVLDQLLDTLRAGDVLVIWKLDAQKFDGSKQRKTYGRPRIDKELEALVVRMARRIALGRTIA
jgi:DNA invertase Pin-like site-specific DNA recombinase